MTLAQVVYLVSTDGDFAAQMRSDPNAALLERGVELNKEDLAFLLTVLKREAQEGIEGLLKKWSPWVG